MRSQEESLPKPGLVLSLLPVLFLVVAVTATVFAFGDAATSGPSQVALILAGFVAAFVAVLSGVPWKRLESHVRHSIGFVGQAILILLLVGGLIGTWILAGIVPALIVLGLDLLGPRSFLAASCLVCALVSMATGSSWSTAGTLGLALIGVGHTIGISPGMSAGAVISGSYFGDKMSPFSETTNLASSIVGVDLFEHIRHMLYTTLPALAIALVLYVVLGFSSGVQGYDPARTRLVVEGIESRFYTGLPVLLPLPILFVLVWRRVPAIPALGIGILLGVIFAAIFQSEVVRDFAGQQGPAFFRPVRAGLQAAATGFTSNGEDATINTLLSRGGMAAMLPTIWLILSAMFFSGVLEGAGMLQTIALSVLRAARGPGNLIAATIGTAVFMNVTASEQYLSIVITGRMYRPAYESEGLAARNLSRALEDSGTLTSALVPWNTCGAFMSQTLGVATVTYLPFAFLNFLTPLISILYGYVGFTIPRSAGEQLHENGLT
ncbi:MAG: Na+/H+ antiporter NhaC [Spirochaetales bacterium]|nr:Na+/H+ antiporter NhaC [Leptospiraceae bacterium]MCP5480394.1 Na+/H+ antiporter NhaC [Spirochaetales bacterium]